MRKTILMFAFLALALGLTGAMAHDELDEAHRTCTGPVEQGTDANGNDFAGICIQDVGIVRAGTGEDGGFIAADGAKEMGPTSGGPETWLDGYLLVTGDSEGNLHVYCAGNGAYENGAQPDDELGADCGSP